MDDPEHIVKFSVILPTRNRPEMFEKALISVLSQSYSNKDIHAVIDGISDDHKHQYDALIRKYRDTVNFHILVYRKNGHGHSYALNYGVSKSSGNYLCFLDDDDYWIDDEHLARVARSIKQNRNTVELYLGNQEAIYSDGTKHKEVVWLEDLSRHITGNKFDIEGSTQVDLHTLLNCNGFSHLNCSVYARTLYNRLNGMDEGIRYEEDRDIYLRALSEAEAILYNPAVIARHNIPDREGGNNLSTSASEYEKRLYQLRVYDKNMILADDPLLMQYCKKGKCYQLKHLANALLSDKKYRHAYSYSVEALSLCFTIKWSLFTLHLFLKQLAHA